MYVHVSYLRFQICPEPCPAHGSVATEELAAHFDCPPALVMPGSCLPAVSVPGEPSAWAANVASIFLKPFGLANPDSTVSAAGTNGNVLQATRAKLNAGFPVNVACNDSRYGCSPAGVSSAQAVSTHCHTQFTLQPGAPRTCKAQWHVAWPQREQSYAEAAVLRTPEDTACATCITCFCRHCPAGHTPSWLVPSCCKTRRQAPGTLGSSSAPCTLAHQHGMMVCAQSRWVAAWHSPWHCTRWHHAQRQSEKAAMR
jgi:hypothetical protein